MAPKFTDPQWEKVYRHLIARGFAEDIAEETAREQMERAERENREREVDGKKEKYGNPVLERRYRGLIGKGYSEKEAGRLVDEEVERGERGGGSSGGVGSGGGSGWSAGGHMGGNAGMGGGGAASSTSRPPPASSYTARNRTPSSPPPPPPPSSRPPPTSSYPHRNRSPPPPSIPRSAAPPRSRPSSSSKPRFRGPYFKGRYQAFIELGDSKAEALRKVRAMEVEKGDRYTTWTKEEEDADAANDSFDENDVEMGNHGAGNSSSSAFRPSSSSGGRRGRRFSNPTWQQHYEELIDECGMTPDEAEATIRKNILKNGDRYANAASSSYSSAPRPAPPRRRFSNPRWQEIYEQVLAEGGAVDPEYIYQQLRDRMNNMPDAFGGSNWRQNGSVSSYQPPPQIYSPPPPPAYSPPPPGSYSPPPRSSYHNATNNYNNSSDSQRHTGPPFTDPFFQQLYTTYISSGQSSATAASKVRAELRARDEGTGLWADPHFYASRSLDEGPWFPYQFWEDTFRSYLSQGFDKVYAANYMEALMDEAGRQGFGKEEVGGLDVDPGTGLPRFLRGGDGGQQNFGGAGMGGGFRGGQQGGMGGGFAAGQQQSSGGGNSGYGGGNGHAHGSFHHTHDDYDDPDYDRPVVEEYDD